jgi:hypothetical protein
MTDNVLAWAERYVHAGLPVLPVHWIADGTCSCSNPTCRSAGKHPLVEHGVDDASVDIDVVRRWFTDHPSANIALRPPPGVAVIDVDPRHRGATTLLALSHQHNDQLTPTWAARTGGGGLHAWYRYAGVTRGRICDGVDLKTSRGYVLVEPSNHVSGGHYKWITNLSVAPMPSWIRRVLAPPPPRLLPTRTGDAHDNTAGLIRSVADAQEGNRNAALHWAACRAVERGDDPRVMADLVHAAVSVGLSESEATRTIASARRGIGGAA